MINFTTMPRIYPEMAMWAADSGNYTFVISCDGEDLDHKFIASVKRAGELPFQGQRTDLGAFDTFAEAKQACEAWLNLQRA
jgi:hypothetical protein